MSKVTQSKISKRDKTPDAIVKLPGIVDLLEEEDRIDQKKIITNSKSNLRGKVYTDEELVYASREARKNGTSMPKDLYDAIKVRPPPPKKYVPHTHFVEEAWIRFENSKNYSPQVSIMNALRAKKLKLKGSAQAPVFVDEIRVEEDSKSSFRDRLVDYLMYIFHLFSVQQNFASKSDRGTKIY
jgi:hypothetical protein